ncbi:MAG: Glycine oxidase [Acidobacteriales bacterium]|nr:Glycine oxidase [Terriglobales bacterium]
MKSYDAIIIGGGIIGVSLALELRHSGMTVLIVERGEPGREASHAGAGMLAALDPETPAFLKQVCIASAKLYPEFVAEMEAESGLKIDFRRDGTIYLAERPIASLGKLLTATELKILEPELESNSAYLLEEDSVEPRDLMAAALEAAKHRGVDIVRGSPVAELLIDGTRVAGVVTARKQYSAPVVVNCAGAWAADVPGFTIPSRPVKGQLFSVVFPHEPGRQLLRHVVRAESVYIVPRSNGRILIGATVEEAGFDKRVQPDTIQRMHQAAANIVPQLGEARIHEVWAGLRPGTPDDLPIMGATSLEGYFVSTGHYRNGILLAPISALLMSQLIRGDNPHVDLSEFSPLRFAAKEIRSA